MITRPGRNCLAAPLGVTYIYHWNLNEEICIYIRGVFLYIYLSGVDYIMKYPLVILKKLNYR